MNHSSTSNHDLSGQSALETVLPTPAEELSQNQAPTSVSSALHSRSLIRKKYKPSCHVCRRRKIKCDRGDPCAHCVRVGAQCVSSPPSGVPRGRKGGRRKLDRELLDRIAKLENLMRDMEGGTPGATPPVSVATDSRSTATEQTEDRIPIAQPAKSGSKMPKESLDRYLGGSLWMSLSDEIHGLREILDQSSDEDNDDDSRSKSNSTSVARSDQSDFVICVSDILPDTGRAPRHPTRMQAQSLFSSFMANVEPVVKLLHSPSLRRYLIEEIGELDCSPGPRGWNALKFAMYYTSTTSLTPHECLHRFGEEKSVLLSRFRSGTELLLARADFVNAEEISVLQALVLYLFAVRSNENSRRTWTLTSLAIRIAHALGLHRENYVDENATLSRPFEREMRRRLWWQICVLDGQACVDRGSDPIITAESFSTPLPLHVNDADLIPEDSHEVQPRQEYTDTTLTLVCQEIYHTERRLNYISVGELDRPQENTGDPWAQRRSWVVSCQQRIENKYLRHCNPAVSIQRYTLLVADIMVARMWLFTYRPLQKHPDRPSPVKIPHLEVLHLSIEVMEKAIRASNDASIASFQWMSITWVQWHALAVMIAELCVQTEGPTVERAWAFANTAFEETARHVADSDKGRLWRPIKKLMSKAQVVRRKHLEDAATISDSLSPKGSSKPKNSLSLESNPQIPDLVMREAEVDANLPNDNTSESMQEQQPSRMVELMSSSWDPLLATEPLDHTNYDNELGQMAWINWESFVDDFQAHGVFLPGEDGMLPSAFTAL